MAVIPITNEEKYIIWGIFNRHPELHKRVKLNWGIIRPSVSVKGIVEWLIGDE